MLSTQQSIKNDSHFEQSVKEQYLKNTKTYEKLNINSFNLLSVIGKGAYAKVVLVRKKDTGQLYALKVLKKSLLKERNILDKVLTERDILRDVEHPFINKLYYAFSSDSKIYFVLQFCQGGDLYNLLQKVRRLKENDAKFYAAQIFLALEHLHSLDVLYRDLKPENVLIDKFGYIRLTDFGLSKKNVSINQGALSICGTPEYMAPEMLRHQEYGKSADWWMFASILYEMVTGQPAFINNSDLEGLKYKILNQKIYIPSSVSPQLRELLEKLFQKDPSMRLGSKKGAEEIKESSWFKGFNWLALYQKQLQPPYIPKIEDDADVSEFAEEFVQMSISSSQGIKSDFSELTCNDFSFNCVEQEKIKTINTQLSDSPEIIQFQLSPQSFEMSQDMTSIKN